MAIQLLDRCIFATPSSGLANFVIGAAPVGYQTPAQAGAVDTNTYYYAAQSLDLTQWEVGLGTYSLGGNTLARTTIFSSSNAGAKVNFSGSPIVSIDALAATFATSGVVGAALTKVDDTNVGLTLGGSPTVAVLVATSITVNWVGQLAVARGGTGAATLTGLLQGNGVGAFTGIANSSTVGQVLRVTGAATYGWGAVDLADPDAITGSLPLGNLNISATQRVLGRNSAGAGIAEEVTASQLLDWIGSTRGSVIYRGVGGWAALTPGVAGTVLTSAGAGADPSYAPAGGTGTVTSVATGYGLTGGPITTTGTVALDATQLGQIAGKRRRNHNGRFEVDQINGGAATTTADNTYFCDRWRYIGEASASLTAAIFGGYSTFGALATLTFTGTTDKGGVFSVIEGKDCKDLRGSSVTLSALLAVSNTRLGNVKMGIAEWTSTEDGTQSDPVSAWGADGVTPTLAAGWAFINTPANLSVTIAAVRYSVTATVGASANNLACVIWNDDKTYNANDVLYLSDVQLEYGTPTTAQIRYERWGYATELTICKRYYQRFKDAVTTFITAGYCISTTQATFIYAYEVEMRLAPTLTVANPTNFSVNFGGVNTACTALAANGTPGLRTTGLLATVGSAAFVANGGGGLFNSNVNAEIRLSAQI